MTQHIVDHEARRMAQAAQNDIAAHARECAIQWSQNNKMQGIILRVLAIGTTGLIGAMGTLIYWLAEHSPHS
jgi:hypothetical protein